MSDAPKPDPMETAIRAGVAAAIRRRVAVQHKRAEEGSITIDGHGSPIITFSPESRLAQKIADDLEAIAAEMEQEGGK
jgi:hypothetical protein